MWEYIFMPCLRFYEIAYAVRSTGKHGFGLLTSLVSILKLLVTLLHPLSEQVLRNGLIEHKQDFLNRGSLKHYLAMDCLFLGQGEGKQCLADFID